MTEVWSCGGGTQSAAIAALIIQGRLPKPDIAVIVDTGREKSTTWEYYEVILKPELKAVGVDLVRVQKSEYATVDLISGNEVILLPGWTILSGKLGKLPGYCSNEWKKRVLQRYVRSLGVQSCRNWLGISTDEMKRVRQSCKLWWQNHYPLVFDIPMSRQDCIDLVMDEMVWPRPPRSSCWMCPNMRSDEWEDLSQEEAGWAKQLEQDLQHVDPHFHLRPPTAGTKEASCMEGMCFV